MFESLGGELPTSMQEALARTDETAAPGAATSVASVQTRAAASESPDRERWGEHPVPGAMDDRRYLASLDVLFGGDVEAQEAQDVLDALDEEEAERRVAAQAMVAETSVTAQAMVAETLSSRNVEDDAAVQPLPAATRVRMEHAFGHSFADVVVHPDSPEATGATHALTRGREIHFRADAYTPGTARGDWLIAHELAHVVQQTAGSGPQQGRRALEAEADHAAHLALAGQRAAVSLGAPLGAAQAFSDAEEHAPVAPLARDWAAAPSGDRVVAPQADIASMAAPERGVQAEGALAPEGAQAARADTSANGAPAPEPAALGPEEAKAARASAGEPRPVDSTGEAPGRDAVGLAGSGTAGSRAGGAGEAAALDTHSPGAILDSLARVPPSAAAAALGQAHQASPTALQAQREETRARMPQIQAPTGLPAREAAAPEREPGLGAPATAPEENLQPPPETGGRAQFDRELVEEAPPAPAPPATELAGREDRGSQEGQTASDPALARSAQGALASMHMPSSAVQTIASDAPAVELRGEADPGQLASAHSTSSQQTQEASREAARAIHQDFGENDIFPASDDELLEATIPPGEAQAPALEDAAAVDLPAEALAAIDAEASPVLQARIGAEQQRYAEGQARYEADSQAAHEQAHQDAAALEEDARGTQLDAQSTAQAEVSQARADWQGEIDRVEADFQENAAAAREEHRGKVQEEQHAGNRKAAEHIAEAERKAALEKRKAEVESAEKKRAAESESKGFWGWVKSAAKTLIDGLKSAIDFIYDNLRKAVKGIFDAAKKLALGVTELARKAIVGLIKAYGALLKGLVGIVFAAFPALRDRIQRRIDQAVNKAVEVVNAAADALKKGVAAVLDFLAGTLDTLLGLIQDLYSGIFTVIGMLITGELQELLAKIGNLIAAARTAPGQFETAAYEELLGGKLDEPLSPAELLAAGRTPPAAAASADPVAGAQAETEAGLDEPLPGPPWTEDNVGVDAVASGETLSPELTDELLQRTGGGDGDVAFGEPEDPSRSLESILGLDLGGQAQAAQPTEAGPQAAPGQQAAHDDGLSSRERAAIKWEAMKKGLADWWSQNWPYVLAGGVLGVAGFIVANILTGGAILGALLAIMPVVAYLFTGLMVVQLAGHLRDFLQKGWSGDIQGGGKSLAKGLAAGAIELVSLLTFKVGSVAMKGAKAAAKGAVKGAQAVARGTARAAKGAMGIARSGASYLLEGGKVLLRGVGQGIGRGAKRLRDLGDRLLSRTRFKGFRIRIKGRRFVIEGRINPWVKVMEGELVEVPEGTPGAKWIDDDSWATGRPQRNFQKPRKSSSNVEEAKRAKEARRQAHEARTETNANRREQALSTREEAIEKLKQVDQPLENTTKSRAGHGHGHKDHGYQTRLDDHRKRIETGKSPSGRRGKSGKKPTESAKFYSPEAELEALQKAEQKLWKTLQSEDIPKMVNDQPNRVPIEVASEHPRGFGGGYIEKQWRRPLGSGAGSAMMSMSQSSLPI